MHPLLRAGPQRCSLTLFPSPRASPSGEGERSAVVEQAHRSVNIETHLPWFPLLGERDRVREIRTSELHRYGHEEWSGPDNRNAEIGMRHRALALPLAVSHFGARDHQTATPCLPG